jgi:hypothetical protein
MYLRSKYEACSFIRSDTPSKRRTHFLVFPCLLSSQAIQWLVAIVTMSYWLVRTWLRDVTHVGSAVRVTSLMTSSRQVRCGVTSFSRHYGKKLTFLALPSLTASDVISVLHLEKTFCADVVFRDYVASCISFPTIF